MSSTSSARHCQPSRCSFPRGAIAFAVEDDYQRLGIASRLLRHLTQIARAKGIARFEAYVLPENASMLQVFRRSGLVMTTKRKDGDVRVTLELS